MTSTRDDKPHPITPSNERLERAAEVGPLQVTPSGGDGDDETREVPPEVSAEDAAAGDVVGGINMH